MSTGDVEAPLAQGPNEASLFRFCLPAKGVAIGMAWRLEALPDGHFEQTARAPREREAEVSGCPAAPACDARFSLAGAALRSKR